MCVTLIKYNFPKTELLEYFQECYPKMKDYIVPSHLNIDCNVIEGFKVDEDRHFDPILKKFAQDFCNYYNINDKFVTQFLVVEPNKILPWHEDGQPATCCVNCLLSDENVPVEFESGIYNYNTALLDIRKKHRVVNKSSIRIMFRIVFYENTTTFDSIKEKINVKDFPS